MKNELDRIKKKYLKKGTMYGYYSYGIARKILSIIKNAVSYDRPDFYYLDKNTCFVCECFEFDASHTIKRKGSSFKRAEKETSRYIENLRVEDLNAKVLKDNSIINYGAQSSKISSNFNKKDWKQNFLKTFVKHYDCIDEYRKNLINNNIIDENKKIKNVFVIEDTTEFGALESLKSGNIFYPFHFDFGIDILIRSKKVNYFVFLSDARKQIVIVNRTALKTIKKSQLKFESTEISFLNNINVVSAWVTIPDNLIK